MFAEFTMIGVVVKVTEITIKDQKVFRFNLMIRQPKGKLYFTSYFNNITIWSEGAAELARKVITPSTTLFVRGKLQVANSSKRKGFNKDEVYFTATSFFRIKASPAYNEEKKYEKELHDFVNIEDNYMLLPGSTNEYVGDYPTYCGDEPDDKGGDDIAHDADEEVGEEE